MTDQNSTTEGKLREALEEVLGLFDKEGALFCSGEYQLEVIGRARQALASLSDKGEGR